MAMSVELTWYCIDHLEWEDVLLFEVTPCEEHHLSLKVITFFPRAS